MEKTIEKQETVADGVVLPRKEAVEYYEYKRNKKREEICEAIRAACDHYGARYLELSNIDKIHGHPSILGMKSIREQIKAALK